MTIIDTKNKKPPRFRVFAALSLAGLIFCILFVIYLKKNYIFEEEHEFARKITIIFFIASVIAPLAYYVLLLFEQKVLLPWIYRRRQRRIEKYGYKIISRESIYKQRIYKVLSPYILCQTLILLLLILTPVLLALGIRRIQVPEGDLSNDTATAVLATSILIPSVIIGCLLGPIIQIRVFKKRNGIKKALKYVVELKKQPGTFTKFCLKASGIKDNDIQSYLSEMPKK